ncbi:MAG: transglutaminase family protein [Mycobacterium sp.]|uniref:transglutaminase-like domain-containing protein n=1 Tax=Mycobacterium sp. TaxID=1785 RepID=UPI00260A71DD|nr:transglutaminase family protein [Mycobacterium sp.]MDI3315222.1 transglutaminase family protein [Mycobacterium sp.]
MTATSTEPDSAFLASTEFLDWHHDDVQRFTQIAIGESRDPVIRARRLFLAVRDKIWYDPYSVDDDPDHYRASYVASVSRAYCIPKAVLLTAAARAAGIPARLGFADVRNHLQTDTLRARMGGTDVFAYHGYSELFVNNRWVKATPAFNAELCARFGVPPIDFDGEHDALLHPYDAEGHRHMEYLHDRGWYHDLPFAEIISEFRDRYGPLLHTLPPERDTFTK